MANITITIREEDKIIFSYELLKIILLKKKQHEETENILKIITDKDLIESYENLKRQCDYEYGMFSNIHYQLFRKK